MTQPWVSADTEIFDFDAADAFIWYPDSSSSITWDLIGNFSLCSVELGKVNSGIYQSTYTNDNNKFILNELNRTPGFCYTFQHTNVPDPAADYFLQFRGTYGGSSSHDVEFQAYNHDTTSYTTFLTLDTSLFTQDYFANIPSGEAYYDDGTLTIRTIHNDAGNSGHLFRINYWELHEGSV